MDLLLLLQIPMTNNITELVGGGSVGIRDVASIQSLLNPMDHASLVDIRFTDWIGSYTQHTIPIFPIPSSLVKIPWSRNQSQKQSQVNGGWYGVYEATYSNCRYDAGVVGKGSVIKLGKETKRGEEVDASISKHLPPQSRLGTHVPTAFLKRTYTADDESYSRNFHSEIGVSLLHISMDFNFEQAIVVGFCLSVKEHTAECFL
ncbi:hypothetical protein VKT23_012553 [Stygiomarasmius scandens]|uniref:Uncharacterized protein n=1 Tax=Marasmiellus scandens TaxID=2682957 RepID=A0ABR1J672_9AGAR